MVRLGRLGGGDLVVRRGVRRLSVLASGDEAGKGREDDDLGVDHFD